MLGRPANTSRSHNDCQDHNRPGRPDLSPSVDLSLVGCGVRSRPSRRKGTNVEQIIGSAPKTERLADGRDVVAVDFSPRATEEWRQLFSDRLNWRGIAWCHLTGDGVKVPFQGQSVTAEAAIAAAICEANG
jgi:hypothetical protein